MKPSFFRPTSTLATLALAVVGVVAFAEPASAAVTRHDGVTRFNWALNCESVLSGYPYVEAAAGLVAGVLYDDAAPPKAGEVFYVVFEGAGIGNPYPCVGQMMRPDIVLPAGLQLAVSSANPIRCVKWDYNGSEPVTIPETALCPTSPQPPESGGIASFGTSDGSSWDISNYTGYEIQVPVVATSPGWTAVQFAVRVLDADTNPLITVMSDYVYVGAGASTTTPTPTTPPTTSPTPTPGTTASASVTATVAPLVKLDRTHGKVPVKAVAGPAGSTARLSVQARMGGKWVLVGKKTYEVAASKTTTVKVRVAEKWRQALDGKRVKAKLVAKVTAPSGDAAKSTTTFALKG